MIFKEEISITDEDAKKYKLLSCGIMQFSKFGKLVLYIYARKLAVKPSIIILDKRFYDVCDIYYFENRDVRPDKVDFIYVSYDKNEMLKLKLKGFKEVSIIS